jgi:hypothetical protein
MRNGDVALRLVSVLSVAGFIALPLVSTRSTDARKAV